MKLTHYTAEPLVFDHARRYTQPEPMTYRKPEGFWVSVPGDDDWPSWCDAEEVLRDSLQVAHCVTLNSRANVLRITDAEGMMTFHETYTVETDFERRGRGSFGRRFWPVDWREVASCYDGIVIAPYQWSYRLDLQWYYGWDCASGCIWRLSAIESVALITTIEEWRPVVRWEGLYEVSNHGRVRTVERVVQRRKSGPLSVPSRIRVAGISPDGYPFLALTSRLEGRRETRPVHQLVLEAFVGPCPPGQECCHGPGGPADNRVENLRWDTKKANAHDRILYGHDFNVNKTRCPQGHEYNLENTYVYANGRRACKTCDRDKSRVRARRKRRAQGVPERGNRVP